MSRLVKTVRFVIDHPLNRNHRLEAVARFLRWQLGSRLVPGPVAVPFVNQTSLLVARGMTGATGNVYCGLHEYEDMGFALHALRAGDHFVDVGANIGSYTVLAAGACAATVTAFEPHPKTYQQLMQNIRLNGVESLVVAINAAVGASTGEVCLSADLDTQNHVLAHNEPTRTSSVRVPLVRLDDVLVGRDPFMLKIDVEGYEAEVLKGVKRTLACDQLQVILAEVNDLSSRDGRIASALCSEICALGFEPCRYDPLTRALTTRWPLSAEGSNRNVLFVRDCEAIRKRVLTAPRYNVLSGGV